MHKNAQQQTKNNTTMKKLLLSAIICLMSLPSFAVNFHSAGRYAEFCVYRFDGEDFLILKFQDDDDTRLTPWTIVKFKMTDGTILRLEGCNVSNENQPSDRIYLTQDLHSYRANDLVHFVRLKISKEQIDTLKKGVKKVVINTLPEIYSHTYKEKGKLGDELSADFAQLKDEMDD